MSGENPPGLFPPHGDWGFGGGFAEDDCLVLQTVCEIGLQPGGLHPSSEFLRGAAGDLLVSRANRRDAVRFPIGVTGRKALPSSGVCILGSSMPHRARAVGNRADKAFPAKRLPCAESALQFYVEGFAKKLICLRIVIAAGRDEAPYVDRSSGSGRFLYHARHQGL